LIKKRFVLSLATRGVICSRMMTREQLIEYLGTLIEFGDARKIRVLALKMFDQKHVSAIKIIQKYKFNEIRNRIEMGWDWDVRYYENQDGE